MADTLYITAEYAMNKVKEPNKHALLADLNQAISDATPEIDNFLKAHKVTATLPLAVAHRTAAFKIAVAHWVGAIIYYTHGHTEQGAKMLQRAEKLMKDYIATHDFGADAITETGSAPSMEQYSNKGEIRKTDLTDPLNLTYGVD